MISTQIKVALIASALLLSACSGTSTHCCYFEDCQPSAGFTPSQSNTASKLNFHGSALGSSFSEYSSGLLHDD
ncbi:hypothetical protein PMI35_01487 [Pseudomonas sp. GM78]|uniref:hypothetical protein n=1 Tax=Pseudomonas sp. GM78 TaxID=1144337 RepID=UPI00026FC28C|nr:hypothetical protein [Pseudomonas sp. GM78]EJN31352.1 hypothetical protein PMI35_01487 [Pseudomonas sp. GM78]